MIERGGVTTLPEVTSWASTNKGPTAQRRAFYDALPAAFAIPGVSVELDAQRQDKYARAEDMLAEKGIAALPSADDPALVLDDPEKRASVERAYAKIAPMFWGPRIPPDEACATLREWVGSLCR